MARALFAALVMIGLAGCGFHLRGHSPLPDDIQSMQVTYNDAYGVGDPPLVKIARQRLRTQGALGGDDATATLAIASVGNSRQVTAVTPRRGNTATYIVTTSVTYSYSVRGATQIAGDSLSIAREYSLNETQRLASQAERHQLAKSMEKQLVSDIFLRIAKHNHKLGGQQGRPEAQREQSDDAMGAETVDD